jgi:hypothetical protein
LAFPALLHGLSRSRDDLRGIPSVTVAANAARPS